MGLAPGWSHALAIEQARSVGLSERGAHRLETYTGSITERLTLVIRVLSVSGPSGVPEEREIVHAY
jgi:hypothetical protein